MYKFRREDAKVLKLIGEINEKGIIAADGLNTYLYYLPPRLPDYAGHVMLRTPLGNKSFISGVHKDGLDRVIEDLKMILDGARVRVPCVHNNITTSSFLTARGWVGEEKIDDKA